MIRGEAVSREKPYFCMCGTIFPGPRSSSNLIFDPISILYLCSSWYFFRFQRSLFDARVRMCVRVPPQALIQSCPPPLEVRAWYRPNRSSDLIRHTVNGAVHDDTMLDSNWRLRRRFAGDFECAISRLRAALGRQWHRTAMASIALASPHAPPRRTFGTNRERSAAA